MGLFSKLLGRGSKAVVADPVQAIECPHATLTARWDSAADMGDSSKATAFICAACGDRFTPEQADELKAKLTAFKAKLEER